MKKIGIKKSRSAKKFKENVFYDEGLEEIIKKQLEKKTESLEKFEELYTMRVDKETKIE